MNATTTPATAAEAQRPDLRSVHRLAAAYIIVALIALGLANIPSVFQALDHAGLDYYSYLRPVIRNYYQGLTLHGVMNVLMFTTFFICGFLLFTVVYALGVPLVRPRLAWGTFWLMVVGLVMAAWAILTNRASVLYTFYPPLKAHWTYYIGLTLVVVGTWLVLATMGMTWRRWRRDHPDERTPLAAFLSVVTFVMWALASIGLAVEMLALLIPWSLGLVDRVDPLLARTLFWYTGHPIVYFWLLPAYVSWYAMVPRMAGGHLYSEPMARVAFLIFLFYSIPVGLHHQFSDPGIGGGMKLVHTFTTFIVFFPSLLTYFNVTASLEMAGRAHGGTGWLGWIWKLPWGNPALTAQLLAMILFVPGGVSGLTNASYNVNQSVHNTVWVPGHFHLTVGAAVALTFMGITYWLIPYLTGRALWSRRLALVQSVLFFVGMALFSETFHRLGLAYMPRRTYISAAPYWPANWEFSGTISAIGGVLLFISGILYFVIVLMTVFASRRPAEVEVPLLRRSEEGSHEHVPAILDRLRPWIVVGLILIAIAYGPVFVHLLRNTSTVISQPPGIW